MLIKENLWPSFRVLVNIMYLEEILGGSVLGSPSCIIDGTCLRDLASHRQEDPTAFSTEENNGQQSSCTLPEVSQLRTHKFLGSQTPAI